MKKLIVLFALLIAFTSCVKDSVPVCGTVLDVAEEYDPWTDWWYPYVVIETQTGERIDFDVTRSTARRTFIGDFACFE